MIAKIQSDFQNIENILEVFKQHHLLFANNTLYLSSDNEMSISDIKNVIGDNCYISFVTPESLRLEPFTIQQWCKDDFIKQDIIRYEQEQQEKLKDVMSRLDDVKKKIYNNNIT